MPVTLKNTERQMRVFNLRHDIFCRAMGSCGCKELAVTTVEENPMTGERMPKPQKRRVPRSLTLLALEKREGLPDAILELPEVKRAVENRSLRVLGQPAAKPVPKPASPEVKVSQKEKDKEKDKDKK